MKWITETFQSQPSCEAWKILDALDKGCSSLQTALEDAKQAQSTVFADDEREELLAGVVQELEALIAMELCGGATGPSKQACTFLLKHLAGWNQVFGSPVTNTIQ